MEMGMELPECPVCLQVYTSEEGETPIIPRVLSCGHSVCESCLSQLPQRFPNTIRCPACNQLVHFPHQSQGPSALPKNIDLLSFINQQRNPNPNSSHSKHQNQPHKILSPRHDFIPGLSWSEDFYSNWKDWVLPMDLISVEKSSDDDFNMPLFQAKISMTPPSSSGVNPRCCFRENQIVSLLPVVSSSLSLIDSGCFSLSYTARIMETLNRLKEEVRAELRLILRASSRQVRICRVYGFWMNSEDGSVFLVCERFSDDFANKFSSTANGLAEDKKQNLDLNGGTSGFAMVGMGLCEALIGLHSEGLVCGCLAVSCFSYDCFSRFFVDPIEILMMGRRVRKCITEADASGNQRSDDPEAAEATFSTLLKTQIFVSPELLIRLFHSKGIAPDIGGLGYAIGYGSDVWSLAFILVQLLLGDSFCESLSRDLCHLISKWSEENNDEHLHLYKGWVEGVSCKLGPVLGAEFASLHQVLCRSLDCDPGNRPRVIDVLRCIRELLIPPCVDILVRLDAIYAGDSTVHCLTLGGLCHPLKEIEDEARRMNVHDIHGSDSNGADFDHVTERINERGLVEGLSVGKFESINLQGHLDCITGLAVGGGFLFSSSFDKTVNVWSLQNFSHLQSFRGHEHRVMAVVFVDADKPLCISADSGGGIFVWDIGTPIGQELSRKWYELKDWRYSGIHAMAVSRTEYLYTGSGDKSIKAWSLQDYNLTCTMNGHKSVVSCLVVSDGVLYSGSWDGTIRLWCLNNHSPLTVLGEDSPGNVASILSLSVDHHMLVAAHENGYVKIWKDDVLSSSIHIHSDAILAITMEDKWLFMGGWNKTINIQELSGDEFHIDTRPIGSIACDSVVTALLYWERKLFVGFADMLMKVYYYGQ